MNKEIPFSIGDFTKAILMIWQEILEVDLVFLENQEKYVEESPYLTSCVSVNGPWCGGVTLTIPQILLKRAAPPLLEIEADALGKDEIYDLAGEFANMVGGHLLGLLEQPTTMSLPVVTENAPIRIPGGEKLHQLAFQWDDVTFYVNVISVES